MPDNAVVCGYGSIGRRHASLLAPRFDRLAVVDVDADARERAAADHVGVLVAADLDQLAATGWDLRASLAVIATWGPSHHDLFVRLVDLGCRHVLGEKPVADSIERGHAMVRLADDHAVAFGVHYIRRYTGLAEGLGALAAELHLGPVEHIAIHGGARCLVTNGIHFVDTACELYGAEPAGVISTARSDPMNPRSRELGFYQGTSVWSFPDGREVAMSFTNRSSLKERIVLYHRDAVVEVFDSRCAVARRRPLADVAAAPSVTRAGDASETVFDGEVPGLRSGTEATGHLVDAIVERDRSVLRPEAILRSLHATIGALAAGRDGVRVALPIDPASALGRERWPIS